MKHKHPTGNNPKTIAVICCGTTIRDYIAAEMVYNPGLPKFDEVWTLNKALRTIKADFGFVLDDLVGECSISRGYFDDIVNISKRIPIMTSIVDEVTESLVKPKLEKGELAQFSEYPIHEIAEYLGRDFIISRGERLGGVSIDDALASKSAIGRELCYLKNSLPMILAYALFIDVHQIYLFGADYSHPNGQRREEDQPNAEYWVGWCRAKGLQVTLSQDTTLCSVRQGQDIYGYGKRQPII